MKDEVASQKDAPFADIRYDLIFDERVLDFLDTKDFKVAIKDYVEKYNEILDASTYFSRGTFNYYNASMIAKSLASNGFFDAKHTGEFERPIHDSKSPARATLKHLLLERKRGFQAMQTCGVSSPKLKGCLRRTWALEAFRIT